MSDQDNGNNSNEEESLKNRKPTWLSTKREEIRAQFKKWFGKSEDETSTETPAEVAGGGGFTLPPDPPLYRSDGEGPEPEPEPEVVRGNKKIRWGLLAAIFSATLIVSLSIGIGAAIFFSPTQQTVTKTVLSPAIEETVSQQTTTPVVEQAAEENKETEKNLGFLDGLVFGLWGLVIILIPYSIYYAIHSLAEHDMFFTIVKEGTAKAILINGQFQKMLMSFKGHHFNEEVAEGVDEWDVIKDSDHTPETLPSKISSISIGGMHWVGIWPFATVHNFRFRWSSLEQKKDAKDGPVTTFNSEDKHISEILVRSDVYAMVMKDVEVKGGVPVTMIFAVTINIVNPYKALFRVDKWLEATLNQMSAEIRRALGGHTYEELISMMKGNGTPKQKEGEVDENSEKDSAGFDVETVIGTIKTFVKDQYGVNVEKVQLLDMSLPQNYLEASTKVYIAQQEASAVKATADGEVYRIDKINTAIAKHPNGLTVRALEAMKGATLILGGKDAGEVLKTMQVGSIPPPSNDGENTKAGVAQ